MWDDLRAYLDAATSPELRDLILDSCNTLQVAGLDQHPFLLRNVIDGGDVVEFDVVYEGIFGTLQPMFTQLLRQFGIQVDPECDLRLLNSILKGLLIIPNWDDSETLNALTDMSEGPEAALADILVVVGDLSVGEYMQALVEVSEDLLQRIADETSREVVEPQPDSVVVAAAQMRLRALLPKANFDESSIFIYALDNGLRLGLPFELTIVPYSDALHDLPVNKLAAELVAFAYASSLPLDVVPPTLDKLKETFSLSIPDMIQLDAEIKRLL